MSPHMSRVARNAFFAPLVLSPLLATATALAQTNTYVIPPSYATRPGNSLDQEPLGVDQIRHATFVDKSYLAGLPIGSKILELRYRREENRLDKIYSSYEPMRRNPTVIPNWEIKMGSFTGQYDNLDPQYLAAVNGVNFTTVFAGQLNLSLNTPTLPAPADPTIPAPFQMVFPLNVAQPLYGGTGIVVQHFAYATRNRTHIYFVDAVDTPPRNGGSVDLISPTSLGCPPNFNRVHGSAPNPGGGNVDLHLFGAPANAPTLSFIGSNPTSWGGVPLPLDLTFMGLPGCNIYTDLLVSVPIQANIAGIATLSMPVPANPALVGAVGYNQWGVLDSRVNPSLGFAMSDGVKVTLGNQLGQETIRMSVISGAGARANARAGYFQPNRGPVFQLSY